MCKYKSKIAEKREEVKEKCKGTETKEEVRRRRRNTGKRRELDEEEEEEEKRCSS